ncbi:MAG: peptidoglycan-associated lipoprotein Pal [Syntrophales bacterium]|nr:peptidoglycan-associated lipoprotein Pal [Syntrophales bacterium]
MRRSWGLTIFTLLMAFAFVSGCAKKTVLKEEIMPKESAASEVASPVVKALEKSTLKDEEDAKKRAEQDRAAREAALKAKAEKEAAVKEEATKEVAELKAAKETAAVTSKELYELADIHFDFDKFSLKDEERAILNEHAEWLNKNKDVMIVIEGHCDERGTTEYNLALGERRASAAARFLVDMGIDAKRIRTISYGEELPLDPGHNEEAWAKNRRAHFVVSSK